MHHICGGTQLRHLMLDLAYAAVVRAAAKSAFVTEWNEEKSFDNIFTFMVIIINHVAMAKCMALIRDPLNFLWC